MPENTEGNTGLLDLVKRFGRGSGRKKITLNRRVLIFFFFLVLSVLFWFLTAMNKEYTTELSYPVRYIRFPEEKVLVNEIPNRLELSVNASGYTLLRYHLRSRIAPIIFDVNSFSLNTLRNDPSTVYILTSYARDRISKQLPAEVRILDINPDSLIFQFAERTEKRIPVKVLLDIRFEKQYMQVGPYEIEPDSVVVSGPEVILDTLNEVRTEYKRIPAVNESFDIELALEHSQKVNVEPSEVWVQVPVEKFTETSLNVPIEVLNLPDSLLLRAFPAHVTVDFQVGLSDYETLNEHFFHAVVDYSEAGSMLGNKLQVRLARMPEYIQSVSYTPRTVEYVLEKK